MHLAVTLAALILPMTGCLSSNRIVGNNIVQAGDWYGELGIVGHLNQITIQAPSDLTKLSIIGDANIVHVEPHVTLGKVEVWGQRNKIYIPARLIVRTHIIGDGSEIIRLQPEQSAPSIDPAPIRYRVESAPPPPMNYAQPAPSNPSQVRMPVTYDRRPAGYSTVTIEDVP